MKCDALHRPRSMHIEGCSPAWRAGRSVDLAQRNTVAQYQGLSRCKISHIRARYRLMPRNVDAVPYSMT
jgi:hypothetical protein